jgi:hypothetical protein
VHHLLFFGALIALSSLLAALEVQIEGPHGWAAKLPTWRINNRFTQSILSGRPLTGYHVYLFTFVFIFVHLPFLIGLTSWSVAGELHVLSFNFLFWILEDFLWFIFNPAFGLKKFTHHDVWWHAPTWWWIAPRDYWTMTALGLILYVVSNRLA